MAQGKDFDTVIKFLLGEGALDGVWFGDKHPTKPGNYWWRGYLREALASEDPVTISPERVLSVEKVTNNESI